MNTSYIYTTFKYIRMNKYYTYIFNEFIFFAVADVPLPEPCSTHHPSSTSPHSSSYSSSSSSTSRHHGPHHHHHHHPSTVPSSTSSHSHHHHSTTPSPTSPSMLTHPHLTPALHARLHESAAAAANAYATSSTSSGHPTSYGVSYYDTYDEMETTDVHTHTTTVHIGPDGKPVRKRGECPRSQISIVLTFLLKIQIL